LHSKRLFLALFQVKISENSSFSMKVGGGGAVAPLPHQDFRHWIQLPEKYKENFDVSSEALSS
jgi:hypothetical protein